MAISRRDLIRLSGATALAAPAALGFDDFFQPAASGSQGATSTVLSACGVCSPACGLKATVQDGTIRFLEGLTGDAHGRGHLCGKGAAGAQFLYDPDRLKYPMKRTNPEKGFDVDPGWVRITWQEALDTIAAKMQQYIASNGPDSIWWVTLPIPDYTVRLVRALGCINRTDHRDECFQADTVSQRYAVGGKTWCNDFENSKYILLFGWDLVTKSKLIYATGVVGARERGAKVVHFSPDYTTTSRVASEWYNIRPGTDLAVALAMINVIVSENLYNKDFVDKYTNFAQFESQIRNHFAEFTPRWASEISDVPAEAIQRIAREFAASGAGIAPAHKKTLCANYSNSSQLVHAISILNILAGTVDRPGGRYFPRQFAVPGLDAIYPPPAYPPKKGIRFDGRDKLPFVDEIDMGMFSLSADGLLRRNPGLIKMSFWLDYTVLAFPKPLEMEEALRKVDFTVVYDFLPTDTVSMADIVLPGTMYLEEEGIMNRDYNAKYPQAMARNAVSKPLFETKGKGYVMMELGKRLAPDYFKKPDGSWISPAEVLNEQVKRAGLGENFADFAAKGIVEKKQDFVPRTTFATPGGTNKCQIYVPQFAAKGVEPLPKWHAKRDLPDNEFPYYLVTFIPAIHKRNSTENNSILNEIMSTNAANIHPDVAKRLGIAEGETVRVRSRAGQVELPAHVTNRVRSDIIQIAHGFGHRSKLLTKAGGKGVRDGDLVPSATLEEMLTNVNFMGSSCIMDAVVTIEKL
jgi:thiosulfate reductase/polysulfide reductase chain A